MSVRRSYDRQRYGNQEIPLGIVCIPYPSSEQAPYIETYNKTKEAYQRTKTPQTQTNLVEAIVSLKERNMFLSSFPPDIGSEVNRLFHQRQEQQRPCPPPLPPFPLLDKPAGPQVHPLQAFGSGLFFKNPVSLYQTEWAEKYFESRKRCEQNDTPETRADLEAKAHALMHTGVFINSSIMYAYSLSDYGEICKGYKLNAYQEYCVEQYSLARKKCELGDTPLARVSLDRATIWLLQSGVTISPCPQCLFNKAQPLGGQ